MASFIRSDLEFILQQILIAEAHAAGTPLAALTHPTLSLGLRTVDGSFNHIDPAQTEWGAADNVFPRLTTPHWRAGENLSIDPDGPGPQSAGDPTSYTQTSGFVQDSSVRTISNLIVDQSVSNPAAVQAAVDFGGTAFDHDGNPATPDVHHIPNRAPDEGLSAPFNAWFTFFGQFFDHGLDLVNKGGSGTVFMPLQPDDPLYVPGSPTNFMVLTRATNLPGPDGVLGTVDDVHEHTNQTSPFVDQNQTYTSHPSHQVFLREYALNAAGDPVSTGRLLDNAATGGLANWNDVKAQAQTLLGISLTDADATDLPLLAVDYYGKFIPGPNGLPQLVFPGNVLVEGNLGAPVSTTGAVRTGHAFLDDIAHSANPRDTSGAMKTPDADAVAGVDDGIAGTYDDELLGVHKITGDGRGNENIALTAVHHVFHAEHNRLVEHVKDVVLATGDAAFIAQWQLSPGVWNGERLFQAAKFGTEMQYQHLVFEEFARKVQPAIDPFFVPNGFDLNINPSIVAEFAHTVYRFGHSMLTETVDRYDPNFAADNLGLIQAFLNPLAFDQGGTQANGIAAGAIVRGMTRQVGNEIDEFVTDALRNSLLGLPLDLPSINLARGRDTGVPPLNAARREFYAASSDANLRPYTSWVDYAGHLQNEASIVNYIAAYGTHPTIASAATLADKRAAALLLVTGGPGEPADRLEFLNSTGAWASGPGGVTTTGLDAVDFWIGGLGEKILLFGGMLGSTFDFVFQRQLEALQSGDRFYYLQRLDGLNFLTEMENNSFAGMIMRNTDATHLPADVFSTPSWILEVDPSRQFHPGLGSADPVGTSLLTPLVMRDNPATLGVDSTYLRFTGVDHVVLGGTELGDTLIGGAGDDSLWGDGGDDRLEGGDGNDNISGGPGNDIITDLGGDDNIKGGDGHDVINGGTGVNLILGGNGNDFIITGSHISEIFGGGGNDFIYGNKVNELQAGNEGDDWIETGTPDGSPGDNFDQFGRDTVVGNDVFLGDGGPDEFIGEGGDDIMVGSPGISKMEGMSGFDWATYKDNTSFVYADLLIPAFDETPFTPLPGTAIDRYAQVEGLSGTRFDDNLFGSNVDALQMPLEGLQGSVLTNIGLISGLQSFFGAGVTSFGAGNIILGGDGSDTITGRGGDDLIDGDLWLNVRISVRSAVNPALEIDTADSMLQLQEAMFAGVYHPGQLVIVRELIAADGTNDVDTAAYIGPQANYTVTQNADGSWTVTDNAGTEGTDRLTNIERIQFADALVTLAGVPANQPATGTVNISDTTPAEDQLLAATDAFADPNGVNAATIQHFWQAETAPGVWTQVGTGVNFTPGDAQVGLALRVNATFSDAAGNPESVFSAPTAPVANVNDAPTGAPAIDDTTPSAGQVLTASPGTIADADGIAGAVFTYQWQADSGGGFVDIAGATGASYSVGAAQVGATLRVVAAYTDGHGTAESVASAATAAVAPAAVPGITLVGTAGNDTLVGTAGNDTLSGLAGADTLSGLAGNDSLDGGPGSDTLDGGPGDDTMVGGLNDDVYHVDSVGDVVIELPGGGAIDRLHTTLNSYALPAEVEWLLFAGTGDFAGTGNALANRLVGGAGNDTLSGGDGNDRLVGNAGNDTLTGGAGDDELLPGAGNDVLVFAPGFGNDTVNGGFDANPAGGQDLLDLSALGVTAANFASLVTITDLGANTLVAVGGGTILLNGVNGVGANTITQADFLLA